MNQEFLDNCTDRELIALLVESRWLDPELHEQVLKTIMQRKPEHHSGASGTSNGSQ